MKATLPLAASALALLGACTIQINLGQDGQLTLPDGGLELPDASDAGAPADAGHDAAPLKDASPVDASTAPDGSNPANWSDNGITYHGGALLTGEVRVYFIWYGDWSRSLAPNILLDWVNAIGSTPWWATASTYYDGKNVPAGGPVRFGGQTFEPTYSRGKSLSDGDIRQIVVDAVTGNKLPSDPNALYFVLSAADVDATSGFCKLYCGFHWYTKTPSKLRYAFVGNPAHCPGTCLYQSTSPNLDAPADSMASIMSHELVEAVTDPDGTGWYDANTLENADKCQDKFGTVLTNQKGAQYNMSFGGRAWLIQQNWVNKNGGSCALAP